MTSYDNFEETVEQHKVEAEKKLARLAKVQIISGADLMQKNFPEPRYIWDSVLPDSGLAVMAEARQRVKHYFCYSLRMRCLEDATSLAFLVD